MTEPPVPAGEDREGIIFSGRLRPLLAFGGVFSGVALLLNILGGVSLVLALGVMTALLLIVLVAVLRVSLAESRGWMLRTIAAGIGVGLSATIIYDLTKTLLSQLDPSPFDPFHVIAIFGALIVGSDADPALIAAAGTALHLLNGTSFGVAYLFLFARDGRTTLRRALLTGVGWGLFLETFQLTLYPGWLDIRLYQEFATISALSHIVYGATLGLLGRFVLRRIVRDSSVDEP
ncbi:MAG: hypothetical protein H0W81_06025 [Chloroflexi bacterium]|nr:hypothetical protein [Chloroflexota bacterium]